MGECYCRSVSPDNDVPALAKAIGTALEKFKRGARALENCGILVDQPEGWGFFYGKPGSGRTFSASRPYGDGHISPKFERMKESEDAFFRFVFTWIDGARDKGWTTHYRAKHMPLAPDFQAALDFLGGFSRFEACPEFDFEGCWWRFTPYRADEHEVFNSEYVHRHFAAHASQFSLGLEQLLAAHADLQSHGISLLSIREGSEAVAAPTSRSPATPREIARPASVLPRRFDVALSFAGTERTLADLKRTRRPPGRFRECLDCGQAALLVSRQSPLRGGLRSRPGVWIPSIACKRESPHLCSS